MNRFKCHLCETELKWGNSVILSNRDNTDNTIVQQVVCTECGQIYHRPLPNAIHINNSNIIYVEK